MERANLLPSRWATATTSPDDAAADALLSQASLRRQCSTGTFCESGARVSALGLLRGSLGNRLRAERPVIDRFCPRCDRLPVKGADSGSRSFRPRLRVR